MGSKNGFTSIFCDWFTAGQRHEKGGLPAVVDGVTARFDRDGNCTFEKGIPSRLAGSFYSSVGILCDSHFVGLSGNVGRFGRPDNLFNLGWSATREKADRILSLANLPSLADGTPRPVDWDSRQENRRDWPGRGATVARLDLTCNFSAGSDAQARAVIRWLSGQSLKRAKRGYSGDESVWWSNTRIMLKAYRKGAEMKAHGVDDDVVQWATDQGIVRVELELKRRELQERDLRDIGNITQEKLESIFMEHMEPFLRVNSSDEPDILASIPLRSRAYASAWLAGQDVRLLCSTATLYRHAKVLRDYGLDILETRNLERFPVKVRILDLVPVSVPDWYLERAA